MYKFNHKKQKTKNYKKKTTKKNNKRNHKIKNIRKTKNIVGKNLTRKIWTGGILRRQQAGFRYFAMDFPNKTEINKHESILQNMLQTPSNITRNIFTSSLGFIGTIIIDGDFAKNDCDDIWALAYLSKNIKEINGIDNIKPRLLCGSLEGGIDIRTIAESDTNIAWTNVDFDAKTGNAWNYTWDEKTGSVTHRNRNFRILGNGPVLVYILGGVSKEEVASYEYLLQHNGEAIFCFIFQSPSNWNSHDPSKVPSNVRSGVSHTDTTNLETAVDNYTHLIRMLQARVNVIIVFTDFEREKRFYNIIYPLPVSSSEHQKHDAELEQKGDNDKLVKQEDNDRLVPKGGTAMISDDKYQSKLNTYIEGLAECYKRYHYELMYYDNMKPDGRAFVSNTKKIYRSKGTYIADLYTVYASLSNDENIKYTGLATLNIYSS